MPVLLLPFHMATPSFRVIDPGASMMAGTLVSHLRIGNGMQAKAYMAAMEKKFGDTKRCAQMKEFINGNDEAFVAACKADESLQIVLPDAIDPTAGDDAVKGMRAYISATGVKDYVSRKAYLAQALAIIPAALKQCEQKGKAAPLDVPLLVNLYSLRIVYISLILLANSDKN